MKSEKIKPAIDKMPSFFLPFEMTAPFPSFPSGQGEALKTLPTLYDPWHGDMALCCKVAAFSQQAIALTTFPAVLLLLQCQPSADLWHVKMVWTPKGNEKVRGVAMLLQNWVVWAGAQNVAPSE